jgi:hypothetical protein
VQNENDMYRLDLTLEQVAADEALRDVSIDASAEYAGVSPVAVEAEREDRAVASRRIEVPKTPIRLDDGRYYRVYEARSTEPDPSGRLLRTGLTTLGPLIGLVVGYRIWGRIEVSHTGKRR